ncbi:MAG: oxidative damage protection protein [Gemmatimonadota bacterium]|nr:oxidative damage protection protein [Gemmatimonadota bacterium]
MSEDFQCTRCDRSGIDRVASPPFPTDLGARIQAEICADCWEEWKRRQMLLINHYGLRMHDARAREFLYENLRAWLFGEGEMTAEIPVDEERPAG